METTKQNVNQKETRRIYFPERVTQAMNQIFEYNITIVEAPMGYGKTTAVKEHLKNAEENILWQHIYDNSVLHFWSGFCQLFNEADNNRAQSLLQLGIPKDNMMMQEALKIIEEIEIPEKTVLVIDDYHLIDEENVKSFIEFLVINEIEHLHIVIISRFINLLSIEELSLKGYLLHITKEIFEFGTIDILKYFKLCEIKLKDKEAEELYSKTEGWISALYLLMLNFKQEGNFSATANINNLLEKAVYSKFSEEIKNFLLTMCIFDSFSFEQAEYMLEEKDTVTSKLLTEITNKNAFVKYDVKTKTYQMHNIFTNFLALKLENKNIKLKLYQRAAQWFVEIGKYKEAMQYFYLCKDFDRLLHAMEEEKVKFKDKYFENDKETLIKYMEECPERIKKKHHMALLMYAIRLLSYNETALFGKTCSSLIKNIVSDEDLSEDLRKQYLGEYELLICFTQHNNITKMMRHVMKAHELISRPSFLFDRHSTSTTFGSPSVLYMFYRETGKLYDHLTDLLEAFPYYIKATDGSASGQEYVMEGEWYFNRGDFENAEISMFKAINDAENFSQTQILICAMFLQIRIALVKGNFSYMLELFQKMYENTENKRAFFLKHTIEICEGFIFPLLNKPDRIPDWIVTGDLTRSGIMFPTLTMFNIVYGGVLLIRGEFLKLMGSCDSFIKTASVFPNLLGQIYTYIYLAAANMKIFREQEAIDAFKQALDIAVPDEVYMPFVENCDYIKPLLDRIYMQGIYIQDIKKILELNELYSMSLEQIANEHFEAVKPKLTQRELEIAQFAAKGMTNKEIGERLFITANTVKTALKSIYGKLSINIRSLLQQYFK